MATYEKEQAKHAFEAGCSACASSVMSAGRYNSSLVMLTRRLDVLKVVVPDNVLTPILGGTPLGQ